MSKEETQIMKIISLVKELHPTKRMINVKYSPLDDDRIYKDYETNYIIIISVRDITEKMI